MAAAIEMAALFSKLTVVIRFSVKPISLFLDLQPY